MKVHKQYCEGNYIELTYDLDNDETFCERTLVDFCVGVCNRKTEKKQNNKIITQLVKKKNKWADNEGNSMSFMC